MIQQNPAPEPTPQPSGYIEVPDWSTYEAPQGVEPVSEERRRGIGEGALIADDSQLGTDMSLTGRSLLARQELLDAHKRSKESTAENQPSTDIDQHDPNTFAPAPGTAYRRNVPKITQPRTK